MGDPTSRDERAPLLSMTAHRARERQRLVMRYTAAGIAPDLARRAAWWVSALGPRAVLESIQAERARRRLARGLAQSES